MILAVGDLVTDVVAVLGKDVALGSDSPAVVRIGGGGQAANTAAWLAAAGHAAAFAGTVGQDQAGRDRLAELRAAGIQTFVTVRTEANTGAIVVLSHDHERTMISDRGANLLLDPAAVADALAAGARWLHLSGYTLLDDDSRPAGLRALDLARAADVPFSVDAASATPLAAVADAFQRWTAGAAVVFANGDEARVLVGAAEPAEQATRLALATGGAAVVKLSGDGAVWSDGRRSLRETGQHVPVVDAAGAGDAFAAGFLGAWTTGATPADSLRAGCRLGARAVGVVGARPPELAALTVRRGAPTWNSGAGVHARLRRSQCVIDSKESPPMLPGLDDVSNAHAEHRLRTEQEIWIVTVRRDGQPQASPVGFLWDGAEFLILSQPASPKVRNLRDNPRIALHLDIDRDDGGGGVLTVEGLATVDNEPLPEDEAATYVEKYQDVMRMSGLTAKALFADYSTVIRVKPTRARAY